MGSAVLFTAAHMQVIEDATVTSMSVNGAGHLIVTRHDGSTFDAGDVSVWLPGRLTTANNLGPGNDPDALLDSGWYAGTTWANSLLGFNIGIVEVLAYDANYIVQNFWAAGTTPRRFNRARVASGWTAWTEPDKVISSTTLARGQVILATDAEAVTGTNTTKATTPSGIAAAISAGTVLPFTVARNRNPIRNGNSRTNQKGITSPKTLAPREMGFDGWECAGIINLDTNPRFEAPTTGWAVLNGSTQAVTTSQAHSSVKSMLVTRTGAGADHVTKHYTVEIGKQYTCAAWVFKTVNGATITGRGFAVSADSGTTLTVNTPYSPNINVWERVFLTFIATTTDAVLYFAAVTGANLYVDDIMVTEGSVLWPAHNGLSSDCAWTGTPDASTSVRGPSAATLTWTTDPHGQLVTLSSGSGVSQVCERAELEAGTWTFSHAGTATMRVYNVGTDPASLPAFAASPVIVTLDGLDDVVFEFRAVGATKTYGKVQADRGAVSSPYESIPVQQELALCQRYYWRITSKTSGASLLSGQMVTGNIGYFNATPPVPMRVEPILLQSGVLQNYRPGILAGEVTGTLAIALAGGGVIVLQSTTTTSSTSGVLAVLYATAAGQWISFDSRLY